MSPPRAGRFPIAVLASGEGTNLQALLDAASRPRYPARVVLVASDRPGSRALARARRAGVPALEVPPVPGEPRERYDARLARAIGAYRPRLVALAGFMRILSAPFLSAFPNRILNIHPALLPAFPGLHAQERAFRRGVRFTGATVHIVDPGVDAGPIVLQAVVPVLPGDTAERLRLRILEEEHRIYPKAVEWFARGRIRVAGGRVEVKGGKGPPRGALHNPSLAG